MDIKNALTSHELFGSLGPDTVRSLGGLSSEKRFTKGEVIYRKDTLTSHFFVVLEGEVRLQLPGAKGGPTFAVGRLRKGEMFGLSPVLGFERYTVTAVAETDATLLAIEVAPFVAMLRTDPAAGRAAYQVVVRAYYARYLKLLQALQAIAAQLGGD